LKFWEARLKNLENIYEQLRETRVKKMAIILEKTDSAYFPSFRTLFRNVVAGKFIFCVCLKFTYNVGSEGLMADT